MLLIELQAQLDNIWMLGDIFESASQRDRGMARVTGLATLHTRAHHLPGHGRLGSSWLDGSAREGAVSSMPSARLRR